MIDPPTFKFAPPPLPLAGKRFYYRGGSRGVPPNRCKWALYATAFEVYHGYFKNEYILFYFYREKQLSIALTPRRQPNTKTSASIGHRR